MSKQGRKMAAFTVKKLSKLAGVSIRTLHHYDQIGLLRPSIRTEKNYRKYEKKELLRLQQILFYRELDFPLKEISKILDAPDFDMVEALNNQKQALQARKDRLDTLLLTIDKTLLNLKMGQMMTTDELYEGFDKGKTYRKEASKKWNKAVQKSENHLRKKSKADFEQLKNDFNDVWRTLSTMKEQDPTSEAVQALIAKHYAYTREFWGTTQEADNQAAAYAGLGEMYVNDSRFTKVDGVEQPDFAPFMRDAMKYFVQSLSN